MKKQVSVKLEAELYDEIAAYSAMNGGNLTGFCRTAIRNTFFQTLLANQQELTRCQRLMDDADRYQMTNRDKADLEAKITMLKAHADRFQDIFNDMAADIYGEGGDNA